MSRPSTLNQVQHTRQPQNRALHLKADQATDLLHEYGITNFSQLDSSNAQHLVITIDRSARSPCILASPTTNPTQRHQRTRRFPFDYRSGQSQGLIQQVLEHLQLDAAPPKAKSEAYKLVETLWTLFREKEAVSLAVDISVPANEDALQVSSPDFSFDDAAFRSAERQKDLHALRDTSVEDPVEVEAERDGIVYVRLHADSQASSEASAAGDARNAANIGTLVNGAGLAMNTVDALHDLGGTATNFLDTGGKATSETVKRSFELVLRDPRVKVIFVNIFGGLTLGDMIANGIILAFKELDMKVPVVVRIRGTNEKEGQRIIAESGLPLHAFDDFEEAAGKVVQLARDG